MTEPEPIVEETPDDAKAPQPEETPESETQSDDDVRERTIAKIEAKQTGEPEPKTESKEATPDKEEKAADFDWDDLAERSIAAGMSDEELEGFDDPKQLDLFLKKLESRRDEDSRKADEDPIVSDDDLDLENEWLDDDMRDRLRSIRDKYESQMSQLRTELNELKSQVEKNNRIAEDRRFDNAIADLGKAYEKVFGAGSTAELDPKSPAFEARTALREEMATIAAGLEALGKAVPEEAELFTKALRSAFGDEVQKIEKARLQSKINKRQKQMTVSPNPRNVGSHTPVVDRDQAIINKIADKMAQMGYPSY